MVQDAFIRNFLTASIAFLIFFFLMRAYWRAALNRASKSPADLPGGQRAFNGYMLLQALLYALGLAAVMTSVADHGYDLSGWDLWRDFAVALLFVFTITFSIGYIARLIVPSLKAIDAALIEVSKNGRGEKPIAK